MTYFRASALYFNLRKGRPLADRRFRQAVAYAVNREDLVKRIQKDRQRRPHSPTGSRFALNCWRRRSMGT
ncbi:MAG: ABC transporter substrate-binding protein [Actinomycetota bacterium]